MSTRAPIPPGLRRRPQGVFYRHLLRNFLLIVVIVVACLSLGALGYHVTVDLPWLVAYLNASMILTGMGPIAHLDTPGAKWFGIFYTLFSAVVFLTVAAVFFAPVAHHVLHRFHLDVYGEEEGKDDAKPRERS